MQGKNGASLESTRKIWRKLHRELDAWGPVLWEKRRRPGYDAAKCLTAAVVQILERQLAGEAPPVGVRADFWREVCESERLAELRKVVR